VVKPDGKWNDFPCNHRFMYGVTWRPKKSPLNFLQDFQNNQKAS
jgi:hypothetical protein